MFNIINGFNSTSNQWLNIAMLLAAVFRVYLEIIKFDFSVLPLTKGMFKDPEQASKFHKNGLYLCLGYIVLSAPFTLFS
ncbi:MAG: hypothetical protein Q7U04_05535 [Bacteriovorax sp.]|nr:hypothetical protein [Bacteriovorax sp.]